MQHVQQIHDLAHSYTAMLSAHLSQSTSCDRTSSRKHSHAEHVKTHNGDKPHICPVRTCNKRFSTSGNLSRHKRLHGYIEPLPCPVAGCVCTFASTNKLAKHMKFHYGSDDVKVCIAPGCGKTFSTTGNLNRHLRVAHSASDTRLSCGTITSSSSCSSSDEYWSDFGSPLSSRTSLNWSAVSPASADAFLLDDDVCIAFDANWTVSPIPFDDVESGSDVEWSAELADALAVLFDEPRAQSTASSIALSLE